MYYRCKSLFHDITCSHKIFFLCSFELFDVYNWLFIRVHHSNFTTHYPPLEVLLWFKMCKFQTASGLISWVFKPMLPWNECQMISLMASQHWSSQWPLLEAVLTKILDTIWHNQASMSSPCCGVWLCSTCGPIKQVIYYWSPNNPADNHDIMTYISCCPTHGFATRTTNYTPAHVDCYAIHSLSSGPYI